MKYIFHINLFLLHYLTTSIFYILILAPCATISYDVTALQFIQDPMHVWFNDDDGDENDSYNDASAEIEDEELHNNTTSQQDTSNETYATAKEGSGTKSSNSFSGSYSQSRYVYLYYTTADEITYSSDLLIDFPGFISATGGNLGLFLEFSFMGMLFTLYGWMEARFLNHTLEKNTKVQISDSKTQNK